MGRAAVVGGKVGMEAPVNFNPVFANNTWEQVIEACQKNKVPDTWVVGSQKTMSINGTDYAIDIIGKNHDTYSDGSGKAPLTFQLHDCYGTLYAMKEYQSTNKDGWSSTTMKLVYLPAIVGVMPSEVQSGIKEVNKLTSAGYQNTTINTTTEKLFLLSEVEVAGSTMYTFAGEGNQYDYYKAGNSKVKKLSGSAKNWWLRSPQSDGTTGFAEIIFSGSVSTEAAAQKLGVAFAFCF